MDHQKWEMMKERFCEQIDAELEKISKMPSLTDVALRNLNDLTDTKKNLLKIDILSNQLEGDMGGNSFRGSSYSYGNSNGHMMGNSNRYMNEPMYGNSYDGGYSMHGSDAYSHLEQAMRAARTENEREAIRQAMSQIHM